MPEPAKPTTAPPTQPATPPAAKTIAPTSPNLPPTTPAKADAVTLVEVHKDGERLHVHPTTVAAHAAAGWRVVEGKHD